MDEIKKLIKNHSNKFQLISQFWEVKECGSNLNQNSASISFKKYNSEKKQIRAFYKPYSKLVNLNIEEE
jgi:hypothetical protein